MTEVESIWAVTRAAYARLLQEAQGDATLARDAFFSTVALRAIVERVCPGSASPSYSMVVEQLGFDIPLLVRAEDPSVVEVAHAFNAPSLIDDPLVVGWAYQCWNESLRDKSTWAVSYRGASHADQLQLGPATQLFTDHYIAEFLLDRTIHMSTCRGRLSAESPVSVCDPACGVGHILLHAMRCMARHGVDALRYQLFGFDIDPYVVDLCRVLLLWEFLRSHPPSLSRPFWEHLQKAVIVAPAPHGTLDRSWSPPTINKAYDIVVANPPYLGRRKLSQSMRAFLDQEYPGSSADLCAAFMQRCIELTAPGGVVGFVTTNKWLRLRTYHELRVGRGSFKGMYGELAIDSICDLGARAFNRHSALHDGVRVVLMCGQKEAPAPHHMVAYAEMSGARTYENKADAVGAFARELARDTWSMKIPQTKLVAGDGGVFLSMSDVPSALVQSSRTVRDAADVVIGVQTNDDRRYVRYVWQVQPDPSRWRIHTKGGGYARWCGRNRWVIDWGEGASRFLSSNRSRDAAEMWIEKPGWCYSWFANGNLGLRVKDAGWSFGRAAASGLFTTDDSLIGFLNSRVASAMVRTLGGKIQLPEGVVRRLTIPTGLNPRVGELVHAAVTLKRAVVRGDPADALFDPNITLTPVEEMAVEAIVLVLEGHIEAEVDRALGISPSERERLCDRFGNPVAWYPVCQDPRSDAIWDYVPPVFHDVRALLSRCEWEYNSSRPADTSRDPQIILDALQGTSRYDRGRWLLPASSLLEDVSRAMELHPVDVVVRIAALAREMPEIYRAMSREPLYRRVLRVVLDTLGHRWWSQAYGSARTSIGPISVDDVCQRIATVIPSDEIQGIIDAPLEDWLCSTFYVWQERIFSRQSPIRMNRRGAATTRRVVHMWDDEELAAHDESFCSPQLNVG